MSIALVQRELQPKFSTSIPRLGFVGVGWIGQHRMKALLNAGMAEIAGIAEPSPELRSQAAQYAPAAALYESFETLIEQDLDGVVIATPNAFHASQSIAALNRRIPVFCQKPLGRNGAEVRSVVEAAQQNNQLLGVDLSYRHLSGVRQIKQLIEGEEIGKIFAADLVFHNAYGPDKSWFYDRKLAGGGCVLDLGVHLVDLAFWMLGNAGVRSVRSQLFSKGRFLVDSSNEVEDFATAMMELDNGLVLNLNCSWKLHAGCDAVISATFYGTKGGLRVSNVNGSFYDFQAERFNGTSRALLSTPGEEWGGKRIIDWAQKLSLNSAFDHEITSIIQVSEVLDQIYRQGTRP
ncbi:MAG: Gfo/Idh/MocA family oxidoreductase [Verrucomicrobiota bacterium]|nr:Gfo/Idh/MocA family oxidoreductase [Verrucomicrobiota bacterium]